MNEKFDGTGERTLARRCAGLAIILGLLAPMAASPLGLGDITLHSVLNQPLDAGIELTALGQTQSGDITVRLASPAAFESAGLDRSLLLTTLDFTVEAGAAGTPYIKVTSPDAVREPFLDFLVEIDWPSGHLLREYTLLLDPPVLVDEEPAPVAAAAAGAPAAAAEEAAGADTSGAATADNSAKDAVPAVQQAHAAGPAAKVSAAGGVLSYGPVQRSDTLWAIASQLQGGDGTASVEQIMMALLKANPEAFYNGNINELKAGYVLRVADPALLTALSQVAATAEVRRQNEQWMDAKRARAGMAGAAPQGATGEAVAGAATAGGGDTGPRLRLSVPPEAGKGGAEGVAEGTAADAAPGSELARLKQELASAMESSAASRQENAELRERLATLQGQIDEMQRLATLKDDTLAALQAGAAGKSAAEGAAAVAPAKPATAGDAARKPASVPARAEPAGGLLDDTRILAIAAGAGVLLISLVWLVVRRRRAADSFDEDLSGGAHGAAPAWAAATQTQIMDAAPAPQAVAAAAEAETEESGLDLMQADDDEIDVLAEADVYLAYRRFDKAEELLREAIKSEPGRSDLALKLLEVQAASGNQAAFVEQAESFRRSFGAADATLWDKVVVMGRRVAPGHALFGGGAVASPGRDPQAGLGEDFSASLELDADIAAELDRLGSSDTTPAPQAAGIGSDGLETAESTDAPLFNMDLSLDENGLSGLNGISMDGLADGKSPEADDQSARTFGSASNVIDFESRTGLAQAGADTQGGESTGRETPAGSLERDLDWLTGVGEDFGSLENADAAEDDFSSLISGEDEVGTKLDLAKAYIDMGDQDSARNILSEVAEEGTQDQQREANELMRQIG